MPLNAVFCGPAAAAQGDVNELLQSYQRRCQALVASSPDPTALAGMVPSLGPAVLTAPAVAELQQRVPFPLPESFVAYLLGPVVESGLEWAEINLPANDGLAEFAALMGRRDLWRLGLLQFATGRSGDDVCFDYLSGTGEPKVVEINHDRATAEAWESPRLIRSFTDRSWPSFNSLVEDLCIDQP